MPDMVSFACLTLNCAGRGRVCYTVTTFLPICYIASLLFFSMVVRMRKTTLSILLSMVSALGHEECIINLHFLSSSLNTSKSIFWRARVQASFYPEAGFRKTESLQNKRFAQVQTSANNTSQTSSALNYPPISLLLPRQNLMTKKGNKRIIEREAH
jgi:hypothetical protein